MNRDFTTAADPILLFSEWLAAAEATEPNDPNAMALATVDWQGLPDVRMVLLKGHDVQGFVFYTNFESTKGRQLLEHPAAAFVLHWKSLRRQVRGRGPVTRVTDAEVAELADALASGASGGNPMEVRVLSSAPASALCSRGAVPP